MDHILAVFSSVTVANRAKKAAKKHMSYAAIVQLPPNLGIRGCSYCLRIKREDYGILEDIVRKNNMKLKAVFVERDEGGGKEYIQL